MGGGVENNKQRVHYEKVKQLTVSEAAVLLDLCLNRFSNLLCFSCLSSELFQTCFFFHETC